MLRNAVLITMAFIAAVRATGQAEASANIISSSVVRGALPYHRHVFPAETHCAIVRAKHEQVCTSNPESTDKEADEVLVLRIADEAKGINA